MRHRQKKVLGARSGIGPSVTGIGHCVLFVNVQITKKIELCNLDCMDWNIFLNVILE